jgi:uncharacterized membrane protein
MKTQRRTTLTTMMTIAISIATLGVTAAAMTVTPDPSAASGSSHSIKVGHAGELRCLRGFGTTRCTDLSI